MDWILDEVIDSMKARIESLRKATKQDNIPREYKLAMMSEIGWLKSQLQEIEDMKNEDIKQTELVDEDIRENKKRAYCK